MAGGTWSPTEVPVLPGLYINFVSAALASIRAGARGVVIAPVKAHWGPVRQFVEITSEAGIIDVYTADESGGATAYTTLRLALLGGAKKVLAYRIADANAAAATVTLNDTSATPVAVLRLDAKYPGARGNNFKVTVRVNPVDSTKKDILLYEGTTLLRTFTFTSGTIDAAVNAINNDTGNKWIVATKLADGNGTLADVSGVAMAGGNSGIAAIAAADYTNALTAFETQEFNLLTLDGLTDASIQSSVVSWVSRVRSEGKGIIAVMGGSNADDTASDAVSRAVNRSASWNHEGVVNVGVGAVLDGVSYSSAQIAAYVAGLIAGQKLSESPTYVVTPFDDVTRRWTKSEMETAVKNGVFLLFHDGRQVKALRGINSLVTLRQGQSEVWKKIRAIRVMDAINMDLVRTAEDAYIGKVNNTEEGRLALVGACKQYMQTLAQGGVIEPTGWDVYLDPDYYGPNAIYTPAPDQVYLKWQARLTDAMEIILGTFIVK
ncbi:Phage tail sheath protein [Thermanaeromonas toyohensis ToBE]|uniref:Phage tail sheath protein n=1 Tax=Thermanaeromonas toyohensis ToBE TaxID=698762 RepID=A0A1W1VX64_9FIRM|nr:phage tail sheath subtilisin-like domain-containing protein [Thermanaeromonas toyohensis]SMB97945.1 Phage tail sheath protein [Thermanaeromonas toyohensis ToBE]